MRLRGVCQAKVAWNVAENCSGGAASSSSLTPPVITSRTTKIRERASGINISALSDFALLVVTKTGDEPAKMLKLLDAWYASNRTVSRTEVQTHLFRMSYNGQDTSHYIDQYVSLFLLLERMGKNTAILEIHKVPMLLAAINPKLFSAVDSRCGMYKKDE